MSYFGKNIRKIRTLKKLSQGDFAKIFNLNRSNIGAYEEGRSEAKIDTIIDIAKYFSISIDNLLSKELTIDDIYHLNKLKEQHLRPEDKKVIGRSVRLIQSHRIKFFPQFMNDQVFIENLPYIQVPVLDDESYLGFELNQQLASAENGLQSGDILIAQEIKSWDKYKEDFLCFTIQGKTLILGMFISSSMGFKIEPLDAGTEIKYLKIDEINNKVFIVRGMYKLKFAFKEFSLQERILRIEQNLKL